MKKIDIMNECAKLIKIPDEVEEDLLDLIKDDEQKVWNDALSRLFTLLELNK